MESLTGRGDIGRTNILGVGVSELNMGLAVETIERWLQKRDPNYVCVTSVHGIVECQHDEKLREIHNAAGLVTPDGMPLVWSMRSQGHKHVSRVYGPDLLLEVMRLSTERGFKHFFYGATESTLERLQNNLERQFPGIEIVGKIAPPFRALTPSEDAEIVATLNGSGADIVWVGLSTPKQEKWMAEHLHRINVPVAIGVGAAFDFHAGLTPQAPKMIRYSGFEWLFRLVTEPRRLWRRYLKIVPYFLFFSACQRLGLKRYALDR
jgi:N-acetylglucosaminyldiphosphoundecaprenol N-acetyl-beta-D-mannosaminyltransferase